jgi:O-antigen ligase
MPVIGSAKLQGTPKPMPHFGAARLLAAQERVPLSWGMVWLLLFSIVAIGRIQETSTVLASLRIGLVTGGLAVLAWLVAPASWQEKLPTNMKPVRYVLMLLGLAFLTIPISIWPSQSLDTAVSYGKTILLFLMVFFWCRTLMNMRRVVWIYCLGPVLLVIISMITGTAPSEERFSAATYDPNDLALVLVMILPMLVYLFSTTQAKFPRLLLGGMTLLCFLTIVRTGSRGGFLAFVLVTVLILFRSAIPRMNKMIIVVIGLIVFIGLANDAYWQRMSTIWAPTTDNTGAGRTDIWKAGLGIMASRPWGVGIGTFQVAEGLSHGGAEGRWNAAHNSFIELGVELGVVGLIIFVLLLTTSLKQLRSIRNQYGKHFHPLGKMPIEEEQEVTPVQVNVVTLAGALETSLLGYIIGGFFLSHAYSAALYTLLALALACHRLAQPSEMSDTSSSQLPSFTPAISSKSSQPA